MRNYIGISRCIVSHWIYQDAEYFKAWFEMLYRARWKEEDKKELVEGQLVNIKRGYFIFGRITWSKRLGITERRLRTLVDKLVADNMIELVEKHNKFTIYKIVNYEKYNQQSDQQESQENQPPIEDTDQQNDQQVSSKRPTSDQQATTKEESIKKDKNEKKDIIDDFTSNEELKEAIKDFIKMRVKLRKPMTDKAISLMLDKLNKLASSDSEKIQIVNNSIENSWQGIFPLKNSQVVKKGNFNNFQQRALDPNIQQQLIEKSMEDIEEVNAEELLRQVRK